MSYENWLNFVFIFLIFVLTKQLESSTIPPSLEPDVKPVLGSDKGPFHRVVGLPVVFGLPGDFLLGEEEVKLMLCVISLIGDKCSRR